MKYKIKKKIEELRNRFNSDNRTEYIVRRYDIKGEVIEDIFFDDAYHAGLLKKALSASKTKRDCSIMKREYEVNKNDSGEFSYITVEKYV